MKLCSTGMGSEFLIFSLWEAIFCFIVNNRVPVVKIATGHFEVAAEPSLLGQGRDHFFDPEIPSIENRTETGIPKILGH